LLLRIGSGSLVTASQQLPVLSAKGKQSQSWRHDVEGEIRVMPMWYAVGVQEVDGTKWKKKKKKVS
jgi:hypothetical protein